MISERALLSRRQWSSLLLSRSLAALHLSIIGESAVSLSLPQTLLLRQPVHLSASAESLWGERPLPTAAPAGSCPFSQQFLLAYPANSSSSGGDIIITLRQWTGAGGGWASRARVARPRQRAGHQPRAPTRTKAGSLNGLTTLKVTSADGSCSAMDCCPITGNDTLSYARVVLFIILLCWCHYYKNAYLHIIGLYWAFFVFICGRPVWDLSCQGRSRAVKYTCGQSAHFMSASLVWTNAAASPSLKTLDSFCHHVFLLNQVLKCHYERIN